MDIYLSQTESEIQIKKEAQGAKVLGISAGRLSNIEVAFPSDKKEQQKIADCLSSIDELITAQTQKLDALKAHKKGLMQQLFPAEGETVPKLRFPEFRDAGEWGTQELGLTKQLKLEVESRPKWWRQKLQSRRKAIWEIAKILADGTFDSRRCSLQR